MTYPEYPKIETLFNRDPLTRKVIRGEYRLPEFALIRESKWILTEKIDGTNVRVGWDGERVFIGGRTDRAQMPPRLLSFLKEHFTLERLKAEFPEANTEAPVLLFGEGYGAGIQKGGGSYGAEQRFVLFDVKVADWWLEMDSIQDIAVRLGVPPVPVLHITNLGLDSMFDSLAQGIRSEFAETLMAMEGVIARTSPLLRLRNGGRLVWKLKTCDFTGIFR